MERGCWGVNEHCFTSSESVVVDQGANGSLVRQLHLTG